MRKSIPRLKAQDEHASQGDERRRGDLDLELARAGSVLDSIIKE